MELYRCPACHHWRCFECKTTWQIACCRCGKQAPPIKWFQGHRKKGRPSDISPRLGTGRPRDARKLVVQKLIVFLDRHGISLRAFGRLTRISPWAIRQAKAGIRSLSQSHESLIKRTLESLEGGKLWFRRMSKQRWDLIWLKEFPFKSHCPTTALYCRGGVLPGSCPKHWKECPLTGRKWDVLEQVHQANLKVQANCKQTAPQLSIYLDLQRLLPKST